MKTPRWWPVLFEGRPVQEPKNRRTLSGIREELSEALDTVDLSQVKLYCPRSGVSRIRIGNYWWLNASPKVLEFSSISVGDSIYTLHNEAGNKQTDLPEFPRSSRGRFSCWLRISNP